MRVKEKKVSKSIEHLMGLFEQQLVILNPRRDLRELDDALYDFFSEFGRNKSIEDVSILDTEYYRKIRIRDGCSDAEINKRLSFVCQFFNFLRDYLDYQIPNPASKRERSQWLELKKEKAASLPS